MIHRNPSRRVVITGMGVITPLGNSLDPLWQALASGQSGVRRWASNGAQTPPFACAGTATEFTGKIDDFGPLAPHQKKAIRKGLKLMCREIQMGVASAQMALAHAALTPESYEPDRIGVVFGCDHLVSVPEEFSGAVAACMDEQNQFDFNRWGQDGLSEVTPLWLLKYLPNMPASHIAIYNDLRGPNNSVTYREASSNLVLGEAVATIRRGIADQMVAGATGGCISTMRATQVGMHTQYTQNGSEPAKACRPFDESRSGMVAGEGAACVILESDESATRRGAPIWGEVLGCGSSLVIDHDAVADNRRAVRNCIQAALRAAQLAPEGIGHVHAHGASTRAGDQAEAQGIADALGAVAQRIPVTAAKSYFGNLGAAGGLAELIASLMAIRRGSLFPILNCERPDPNCPLLLADDGSYSPGETVLNVSYTPQGQASACVVQGLFGGS